MILIIMPVDIGLVR